nr:MAG TPA: hypothetical protein [Caudoviricetes sp.]
MSSVGWKGREGSSTSAMSWVRCSRKSSAIRAKSVRGSPPSLR